MRWSFSAREAIVGIAKRSVLKIFGSVICPVLHKKNEKISAKKIKEKNNQN